MRFHRTSVLIVNTKERGNKVRQMPTHIIMHWRKYVVLLCFLVISIISLSGLMIYQNTSEFYKKKLARANYILSLIDINKAKSAFQMIDSSLYRINSFLQDRGLERLQMENVGGGEELEVKDINEVTDYYIEQINDLENTLKNVPLGRPHEGRVTSTFGYRRSPFNGKATEFHSGIDFKGNIGDTVCTTAGGKIVFAGNKGGYGKCVIVKHSSILKTLYGHLSAIEVKEGQSVKTGEMIGRLGNTGRSTGPHIHYEIIYKNKKINPKDYVCMN